MHVPAATFTLGMVHDNWHKKEQGVANEYLALPSQATFHPELAGSTGIGNGGSGNYQPRAPFMHTHQRIDPVDTAINELERLGEKRTAEHNTKLQTLSRKRLFGNLHGLAKEAVAAVVDLGTQREQAAFQKLLQAYVSKLKNKDAG